MHLSTLSTALELAIGSTKLRVLIPASATGGVYELLEFRGDPGGVSPRPHYHKLADEAFIILDGAIEMEVGPGAGSWAKLFLASAGTTVHVPRGTPHIFRYAAPATRFMSMLTPATRFDEYAPALKRLLADYPAGPPDPAELAALMARHDAYAP